jgi:hypothetical protein
MKNEASFMRLLADFATIALARGRARKTIDRAINES